VPLRRLDGVAELLAVVPGDPYVRAEADPARVSSTWAGPRGSVGWVIPSRRVNGAGHLVALGPGDSAAALLVGVLEHVGEEVGSASVPRGVERALPPSYQLGLATAWEWFSTDVPPPSHPGEAAVRWLGEPDLDEVRDFLTAWSARHDAVPGRPGVLRWCGVREGGRLVATAAHMEHQPGVPFLASVATHGEHRGRGLGAAVTAWITRRLLEEGTGMVTLGMYSDNDVARRLYERLGFVCAHAFTSGRIVRAGGPTPV
jgi:GNAT superfamily N-acetyltransferase